METTDFFRCRIDAMINLRHPLAVLATRLPWSVIEASLAPKFERKDRSGQLIEGQDMLGPRATLVGAGRSNAGRPRMPIRLMASVTSRRNPATRSRHIPASWRGAEVHLEALF